MTQEEKARAYDKVSKEVKDFFEGRQKMYSDVNQTLEYLFPEVVESEDEKIRKGLIGMLSKHKYVYSKEIAWLKKQSERKTPQWMIDFLDNYRRKIGCSLNYDEVRDVDGKILCIMRWLENQGEQEKDILEDAILDGNEDGLIAETIRYKNEKQGGQKPTEWHREDEQNLNACLGYIPVEFLRRWLKDVIHEKYDKPAWSKDDERMLHTIIADFKGFIRDNTSTLESHFNECIDWLKSIKQRIGE